MPPPQNSPNSTSPEQEDGTSSYDHGYDHEPMTSIMDVDSSGPEDSPSATSSPLVASSHFVSNKENSSTNNNRRTSDSSKYTSEKPSSSVLTFRNLSFHARKRTILDNINGSVKAGQTLAIMGPSGSGKTTFLKALTMEPPTSTAMPLVGTRQQGGGTRSISGSCFLNRTPLTRRIVRDYCFVVKQTDQHWPYLTVWETLQFACRLHQVQQLPQNSVDKSSSNQHSNGYTQDNAAADSEQSFLQNIIDKMGLSHCQDIRADHLSGGQQRRLSIALGLVQQPLVLILDEPTTGLDSAAASKIILEIVELSAREHIMTICTIHQPSSRVFAQFDQLMLLSQGRVAFLGPVTDVESYFEKQLGFATPPETNPAEFYLDLVNADFSSHTQAEAILDHWKKYMKQQFTSSSSTSESTLLISNSSSSYDLSEENQRIDPTKMQPASHNLPTNELHEVLKDPVTEIRVLFHRQWVLMIRDPLVYVGRAIGMLFVCSVLASVYVSIRSNSQDQCFNKLWFLCWLCVMPSQFGCVAVLGLNREFKSVQRETNNGSFSRYSYALTKVLTLPIMFIFALFSMGIPFYGIVGAPRESFVYCITSLTAVTFVMDSVAECCAVWIDDAILGMLCYMAYWFGLSIFGGILISIDDLYQPFELLFRLWPGSYYVRSSAHFYFKYTEFEPCAREENPDAAVCVNSSDGLEVLEGLSVFFPLVDSTNTYASDMIIMLSIGIFFKIACVLGILFKGSGSPKRQNASSDHNLNDHSVKF